MELFFKELIDQPYEPTEEDMKDYWSGTGHLCFTVLINNKDEFVIDWDDYSGCVGGLQEMLGLEYALKEGILETPHLKEGYVYTLSDITVVWTRGDGWTTDDDVDYYVGDITFFRLPFWTYLKMKLDNLWWYHIGWRIRQWRNRK